MKKIICLLMSLLALLSAVSFTSAASERKPYVIALPADASAQDRYAAETLQRYLAQILPVKPILSAADTDKADFLIGGASAEPDLPAGGYRILRQDAGTIRIQGAGNRGTLNGIYAFLRDYCGCRWYASDEIVLPPCESLLLADAIDVRCTPYFEYASTDWLGSPRDTEYLYANGLTGNGSYLSPFCHTLSTDFCARDKYFAAHPEYFALHDGKRSPNQLCLTNPDTLRIVTGEVLELLKAAHNPNADLQIISVTQDDNADYCECDACAALDNANGSHAGSMIAFANTVADAVKNAGYDNVAIDTFAYQYTRTPPTAVVPRENVIVRLCDIECCFCHTLDDADCERNRAFMQDLRDWGKICDHIYIWDYTTDYLETACIYPDFGVLQRNVQLFYENNAKGVFEEGNGAEYINVEFAQLRSYLLSRLMQDPYLDFDAEMRGFLNAYYGEAGQPIYRFLQRVTEKAGARKSSHLDIYPYTKDILRAFRAEDVSYSDRQWQDALSAAAGTRFFDRTKRSSLCWQWWKCSNRKGEFSVFRSTIYTRMLGRESLYNDLIRMGVTRLNVFRRDREITGCRSLILLRAPGKWCKLYENEFWDAIEPLVLKLYSVLSRLHYGWKSFI